MQRPRPRVSTIAVLFGLLCAISLLGLTGCVVVPAGGYYGGYYGGGHHQYR